ncbi:hypothetical protein, unlikely [Trypanosoma brucei gambiense DAL972]|uniref:Uncharacterized protein n=1 Tax=Trypanosoma brucei gambiense (strain MHOM/CI/86/DAL972) TaxID=679716 RepID=D0A7E4_TRYB9|nr:hypothetical protein, unlikely [Trypanosoma brucei gambiense DAL972]CBH17595.1 hypothetical protein, unlikely [Trypanosoma brucei gambiense DAL972]|eukprot:XP_011779859.1 hypothetical protein, unlikely [Trypanosoma brucei gambiense DAL972]
MVKPCICGRSYLFSVERPRFIVSDDGMACLTFLGAKYRAYCAELCHVRNIVLERLVSPKQRTTSNVKKILKFAKLPLWLPSVDLRVYNLITPTGRWCCVKMTSG